MSGGSRGNSTHNLRLSWAIRPVEDRDFADITITETAVGPEPVAEQQIREWEKNSRQDNQCPSEWLVAVDVYRKGHDSFLGWGRWGKAYWIAPDEREIHVAVPPSKRRMGVGTFMLDHLETLAKRDNPRAIYAWGRGYDKQSAEWAQKRGYSIIRERTEGVLDVTQFDASQFQADVDKVKSSGIEIRVIWDSQVEPYLQGLHRVSVETFRDVPFTSEEQTDMSYENWLHDVIGGSAKKVFAIALDGDEIVGCSYVWMPQTEGQSAVIDYTGVLRAYRGKGIAFAVKVAATAETARAGATMIRTNNDPDNPAILHLNKKMGFKDVPGPIIFRKDVGKRGDMPAI